HALTRPPSDPAARLSRHSHPHHRQQLHPPRGALEHAFEPARTPRRARSRPPPHDSPAHHRHNTPTPTKSPLTTTTPQKNGRSRLKAPRVLKLTAPAEDSTWDSTPSHPRRTSHEPPGLTMRLCCHRSAVNGPGRDRTCDLGIKKWTSAPRGGWGLLPKRLK